MYHSGSALDVVGAVLSVIITVFWIGVWHVHLISIMYGKDASGVIRGGLTYPCRSEDSHLFLDLAWWKWRLHRSTSFQVPPTRGRSVRLLTTSSSSSSLSTTILTPNGTVYANHTQFNDGRDSLREKRDVSSQGSSTIIQVEATGNENEHVYTLFHGDMLPGVSVLKPLVGVDQYLMHNLETFFQMSYPKFELLFCVPDESDPAIMVVQSLMKKYPSVDARIFVGGENVGVNPKINNMMPGYRASKYDLVLVSDSGIMMRADTLLDMVYTMLKPELDRDVKEGRLYRLWSWLRNRRSVNGVGLVHQMPFSMDRDELGFPACLEKVYFGTAHARIYLSADCVGINCPTGMSALMRKNLLENKGGMGAFGKYLAEDYFFAKAVTDQGWIVCISSQPAWQNSAVCHLAHFQGRLERWAKLRFAMVPLATLLEPFQECVLLGFLASFAISFLFGLSALGVFLVHVITWFLLDWMLLKIVQNGRLKYSKLDFIISWIFRETTCLFMFFKALLYPQIEWKCGLYRLRWGGLAEIVKPPPDRDHHSPSLVTSSDSFIAKPDFPSVPSAVFCDERGANVPPEHYDVAMSDRVFQRSQDLNLLVEDASSSSDYETLSLSPKKTAASTFRSRHIRSRSLPQKNSLMLLFNNFSSKLGRQSSLVRSTCDDLVTSNYSFRSKSEKSSFF